MQKGLIKRLMTPVRPPSLGPDLVYALLSDQGDRLLLAGSVILGEILDLSASVSLSIMGIK